VMEAIEYRSSYDPAEPLDWAMDWAMDWGILAQRQMGGRYGYRRISALLRVDGWTVNVKRVHRIWRGRGSKSRDDNPDQDACGSMMDLGPYRHGIDRYHRCLQGRPEALTR